MRFRVGHTVTFKAKRSYLKQKVCSVHLSNAKQFAKKIAKCLSTQNKIDIFIYMAFEWNTIFLKIGKFIEQNDINFFKFAIHRN